MRWAVFSRPRGTNLPLKQEYVLTGSREQALEGITKLIESGTLAIGLDSGGVQVGLLPMPAAAPPPGCAGLVESGASMQLYTFEWKVGKS